MAWLLWWHPPCLRRAVLVNLISDSDIALRGVLWQVRGAWLVLRQVTLVKAHEAPAVMDGEVVVHRSNVAFIQVVPAL